MLKDMILIPRGVKVEVRRSDSFHTTLKLLVERQDYKPVEVLLVDGKSNLERRKGQPYRREPFMHVFFAKGFI